MSSSGSLISPIAVHNAHPAALLRDKFGRTITDLRVSITDRCNYKCVYCRTGSEGAQYAELAMPDYLRMIRVFVNLGIEKVRLTGGEPLLRKDIVSLVARLAELRTKSTAEPLDLAITTNGHLLAQMASPLAQAGLSRITVSMDAVDSATFARITRVPGSFEKVLAGVRAAQRAGLGPVKVNCVLLRGFNDDQIIPFARFSRDEGVIVRFIEFMPLEEDRLWTPQVVVPLAEVVEKLNSFRPLVALAANSPGETARRYTFDDGVGKSASSHPYRRPFAEPAAAFALLPMAKSAPAFFPTSITIFMACSRGVGRMRISLLLLRRRSRPKRRAITSASLAS